MRVRVENEWEVLKRGDEYFHLYDLETKYYILRYYCNVQYFL